MILVYTNSRERAMRLATAIDGVVLRNKQKIRPSNYDSLRDILEQELITDGYVRAFFRGMPYVFLYSDGPIKAPCKMVDYDASYRCLLQSSSYIYEVRCHQVQPFF